MGIFDIVDDVTDFVGDTVGTVFDTVEDAFDYIVDDGEGPSRENVEKLIDAGLTVAAISDGFGVAESVIEALL